MGFEALHGEVSPFKYVFRSINKNPFFVPLTLRSLRSLLDSEMEHSGNVKGQLEELLISSQETEEKLQAQIGALLR